MTAVFIAEKNFAYAGKTKIIYSHFLCGDTEKAGKETDQMIRDVINEILLDDLAVCIHRTITVAVAWYHSPGHSEHYNSTDYIRITILAY
jgi:hypothetical protein